METPDLAYQVLPWYQFQARAWHEGVFPLWDPHQWSGQPVIGQMQPGGAFPLNWPLFLAPLKNGHLRRDYLHYHFVVMHLLAALFMYAFCRRLESSRYASILAGCAFSFGGYLGTTAWPQMLNGALWIPLVFLFLHRAVDRGWSRRGVSSAALCGATIGVSLLSGHHQAPMFTALALTGVFAWFIAIRRGERRRLPALFGIVVLFAVLTGALQWLPAWEYGSQAYRWVTAERPVRMQDSVPYYAHHNYGIFPLSLLGTVIPKAHLTTDPFLGFVALSFAVFAVAVGWSRATVRLYAALALAALAYAAGHYSLFHGWIYTLAPFIDKARSPGHAIFVFQFAAFALAAQGLDLFLGSQDAAWERWRSRIAKGLVSIGLFSWGLLFWLYLNLKFQTEPGDQVILASVVAMLLAGLVTGYHQGLVSPRATRVSVLLLMLFELSTTSHFFLSHRDDPKRALYLRKLTESSGWTGFLKAQQKQTPEPFRFDVASQDQLPANLGDWEGLESTRGYLVSVSDKLYDFVGWDWGRATLVLNTVYVVAKEPARSQQVEVYADPATGWKVFRNPDAFPRAWVVGRVRAARDAAEAAALFRSPEFDPRRETFLIAGAAPVPKIEPCAGESKVEITGRGIHRLAARSVTPCPAMLVFAEPHFPGWEASVDGQPAELHAPLGALRGVVVPAGEHSIEMAYRPYSVYLGAALTALGLLACAALAVASAAGEKSRAASASR